MKQIFIILILFCSIQVFGQSTNGAKGYWRLDGNSTDASGNTNNGTNTNIAFSQPNGRFNQGAGFNGSNSYIYLGTPSSLNLSQLTISAWIYITSSKNQDIVARDNTLASRCYNFGVLSTNKLNSEFFYNGGSSVAYCQGNTVLTNNKWYHVAVTYNGSTFRVYVNGVQDGLTNSTISIQQSSVNTYIGKRRASDNANAFSGNMDNVIIDNTAWSAAKVKTYYILMTTPSN